MNTRTICGVLFVLSMLVYDSNSVVLGGNAEPPVEAQAPAATAAASLSAGTPARTITGEASSSGQRIPDRPSAKSSPRMDGNDGGAVVEYSEYLKLHRDAVRAYPFR